MTARKLLPWLTAAALLLCAGPSLAVTDAERMAVYKDFLVPYQARNYAEAQPLAEKLVSLTETQYGADNLQLVNPLTNLATVHSRQGHYPQAIENYQRALRILQSQSSIADKAQIIPLHGLGVAFLASQDAESAVVALKRAADLSRNTDGLFNIRQIEFIDALIEAYSASGRYVEADKEAEYALRVEEAAYGRGSVKLIPRLQKLADWYESGRRYSSQRAVFDRALAILGRGAPENDLRRVEPLRGITRSYRLEAFYGSETADMANTFSTSTPNPQASADSAQQRRGEQSLLTALEIIDANQPVDMALRGAVLADLGDWYLISNSGRRALETYADAWKALAAAGSTELLSKPRLLAYRPPISSVDRSQLNPAEAVTRSVELRFSVDRDGRVDQASSPTTDVPEAIVRSAVTAVKRSRYAPRIENGQPVRTDGLVAYERVLFRATPTEAPSATPETPVPPAGSSPEPVPAPGQKRE